MLLNSCKVHTNRVTFEESSSFLSVITEATNWPFCFRALHTHSLKKQRCGNGSVLFSSIFGCCHSEPGQSITSDKKRFHFCSCYVLLHSFFFQLSILHNFFCAIDLVIVCQFEYDHTLCRASQPQCTVYSSNFKSFNAYPRYLLVFVFDHFYRQLHY